MKACIGPGSANKLQHRFVTDQRLACPILTDQSEHAMLNPIPLRCSGWIVRHADHDAKLIGQVLQPYLPGPRSRTVPPSAIGLDQQPLGLGVIALPFGQEPTPDRCNRKGGGLMGCTDHYIPGVPLLIIIDAVGDADTECIPAKVMIQDAAAAATVTPTRILEVADQVLLFRIDADHRPTVGPIAAALLGQIAKLAIPIWMMRPGQTLAIGAQQEPLLA